MRRLKQAGLRLSVKRVYAELKKVKQVINLQPKRRGQKTPARQVVFTQLSPVQDRILDALDLKPEMGSLG
jgi:hypothetical protein